MGKKFTFYEFFAGAGMARAGLSGGWECLFANDSDLQKQQLYLENWAGVDIDPRDVALVRADDLKGAADLAWASFPCQDLSQAGSKLGVGRGGEAVATRSGALWPFLGIIGALAVQSRQPTLLVLENVVGLLNSNGGSDFQAICSALSDIGYAFGAVVVDASYFVPQSRPRVFVIALRRDVPVPSALRCEIPCSPWHTKILLRARRELPAADADNWVWWNLGPAPGTRNKELHQLIDIGDGADWNTNAETERFTRMMSPSQLARLADARAAGRTVIGSLYLRMRPGPDQKNVQRAEIAFGDTLGCLRTPRGGASRPRIIVVDGERVRTRLLSTREAASLMGLDEDFALPPLYYDAFKLIGDGVVPAVVRFLAARLLEPLAAHGRAFARAIPFSRAAG
ncbi:DNA cytosine methyltransferase [Inquilinus sp. NPDC058860]|uniref:DNA cytosine methyltransferase n=1 Tax=Inquilinus sp. NPDC058860 TaxID=3346652 RepID=UPI0036B4DEB5